MSPLWVIYWRQMNCREHPVYRDDPYIGYYTEHVLSKWL